MARSALAWAVACAYAQLLVHLAAAQGSSTDPGAPPPMPAPRPSPPLAVDWAPKDAGQPWWMLLILVACALLIILLVVAATFSMSWCFNVIRERTTSDSYLERSELSQLSVTASAWATAAAAMRAQHQAQQSAAPQRKGVSMDILETLPKFQFKDVAAQHPVANLAQVVVELNPCCRRDGAAMDVEAAEGAVVPATKAEAELAAASCAASEAREGCQNTTLGQRQEQQRCQQQQQQQQCQEEQQRQEQGLPGTAKPSDGCSPDDDVERGSCEASSQLGRSGSGSSSDDTYSASSGKEEGPTPSSSTVAEQGQGTAAHAAPGTGGGLRLGPDQCCAICLEPYSPECVLRRLPCGHCFHARCVDAWLLQNGSCPSCRSPLMQGDGSSCCKP